MSDEQVNRTRRRLLIATTAVGGAAMVATATPFVLSMTPSERAKAAGAPVQADISKVEPGMLLTVEWRSKPVWVLHRTKGMLDSLSKVSPQLADPASEVPQQPSYCKNLHRSRKPEYLVLVGICTHLGCSPVSKLEPGPATGMGEDWLGGFFCPCHGSKFDLAGRVFKSVPAPVNLVVPPYQYLSDSVLLIGEDSKGA